MNQKLGMELRCETGMPVPRFTIVIPLYQSINVLRLTLSAVQALDVDDWECILVDDGSPDMTKDVALTLTSQDVRFKVLSLPEAHGSACPARNLGAAHAHADSRYIMFLDHDDLLYPDALSHMANLLDANPEYLAVHGTAISDQADPDDRKGSCRAVYRNWRRHWLAPYEATTFESLATGPHIPAPGTVLCRNCNVIRNGLFPEGRIGQLDYDGWLRLLIHGNFLYTEHRILFKRHPDGCMTTNSQNLRERIFGTIIRTSALPEVRSSQRNYLLKAAAMNQLLEARAYLKEAVLKVRPRNLLHTGSRLAMAFLLFLLAIKHNTSESTILHFNKKAS